MLTATGVAVSATGVEPNVLTAATQTTIKSGNRRIATRLAPSDGGRHGAAAMRPRGASPRVCRGRFARLLFPQVDVDHCRLGALDIGVIILDRLYGQRMRPRRPTREIDGKGVFSWHSHHPGHAHHFARLH